jgi:hypothetical protein
VPVSQETSTSSNNNLEWSNATSGRASGGNDDAGTAFAQEVRSRRGRKHFDPSMISYENVPFKVGDAVVGRVAWSNEQGARVTIKGFEMVEGCVPVKC